MMKVVDLFCGCGGMGLGFQQAGFEIVYALDFDKYAVQSYRKNVGSHVIQGDIREVKGKDIPAADVWTFGFPCQDVSVAGKQAGMEVGTRSGLFYEVMRLLDERDDKPEVIMAENVKGLKPYLNVVEEEFAKRGYKTTITLYNSKYWGVPQSRERYYIVGYRSKPVRMPLELAVYDSKLLEILEDNIPEKYFIQEDKARTILERAAQLKSNPQDALVDKDGAAYCCTSRYYKGISPNSVGKSKDTHIVVAGRLDIKVQKDQQARVYDPEGISPTITAVSGGHHHHVKIIEDLRVRRLTPREYARLQGFPESYEIVVSDTQAYKQFGNSVTVPLVKAIAETIKAVLT